MRGFALLTSIVAVSSAFAAAPSAHAQQFPSKPVTLLVGFQPGGSTDAVARVLARSMGESLGQPVVVENKGGAEGALCASQVAKAAPDGHLLCMSTQSTFTSVPHQSQVDYNFDDLRYVARIGDYSLAYVVKKGTAFQDWKSLVAHGKKAGELAYGANTQVEKLLAAHVGKKESFKVKSLPYKGGSEIMKDILGEHIQFGSSGGAYFPHVDAGTMTVIAAPTSKRLQAFPNAPTLLELGYDFAIDIFIVVAAPKRTPDATVAKLEQAFAKAVKDPEYIDLVTKKVRMEINFMAEKELTEFLRRDAERMGNLIKTMREAS